MSPTTYTLAEALSKASVEGIERSTSRCEPCHHGQSWHGAEWSEALSMAENGDKDSAAALTQHIGARAAFHTAPRATSVWGEAGSTVDVARYLSGEPECMVETVRARRPVPVIRIGIERAVSWATSTEDIRATGASVLACVEGLRTAGVPSEVWVAFSVRGLSVQVLIQEAGRPIDFERLAYWVVNPSALRRIGFALFEHEPEHVRKAVGIQPHGSYGCPVPLDPAGFDEVVPATASEAELWIRDVLKRRAGVEIIGGAR